MKSVYLPPPRFCLIFAGMLSLVVCDLSAREPLSFNDDIRPILSENCFFCHGPDPDHREADLRLDDRQAALDYLAIVPGEPGESSLVERIVATDPDIIMPPPHSNRTLSAADIAKLKRWIAEGANYDQHWAFKPIHRPPVPVVSENLTNPIDHFVSARLEQQGLSLQPPADKPTLIRRLCYDLTGLPPTLAQIDDVLADDSPQAIENFVDRLLASPAYGERMTSEWLDVARYSDSYGYQVDRDRYVWPWRDWVINAFNQNMPYDQFLTEQIAGDLLPDATKDQILATTFNRLHPQKVEGGSVPEEFRIEYIADRTQTFGTAVLGLTVECARCHTHKYDPITHEEYYQLTAFFDNIDEAGLYSFFTQSIPTPTLLLTTDEQDQQIAAIEQELTQAEQQIQRLTQERETAFQTWLEQERTAALSTAVDVAGQPAESDEKPVEAKATDEKPTGNTVPPHPLIPGRVAELTFENQKVGRNQLVAGRDGRGQAVQLTGDDVINLSVGNFRRYEPFTVSLWLNTPDVKDRAVIYHRSRAWTDAASRGYELLIEDGKLSAALIHFWPGNAIRVKTQESIPVNQWLHVAVTYDGSSRADGLQIVVNGQPASTEIVRDQLTKNITGGGGDNLAIGERFRDRGFTNGLVDDFQVYARQLTALEVAQLYDDRSLELALSTPVDHLSGPQVDSLRDLYYAYYDVDLQAAGKSLRALREQRSKLVDSIQEIMVMQETPKPVPSFLLKRGVYDAKGQSVDPEVFSSLHPFPAGAPRNRLGLARWVTDPANPLTARVTVNRYWQMLFGEGLVRTPEDFGSQGQPPTHPLLLDWLAADFQRSGWDVQRMLKQIVLSKTYQQSSVVTDELLDRDPENRLLTRFPSRRLPAEMIRDTALAASGLLVEKIGGAPVKPYEVEASFKPTKRSTGDGLYRRSLYTYWKRNAPAPVMLALDASIRDVCRVKREKTMSPLQAFVLLNGPQFVEASRVLAESLLNQHGSKPDALLTDLFRRLTARKPTDSEMQLLQSLYATEIETFKTSPAHADELLRVGDKPVDKSLDKTELAALAVVANTLLNFNETQMQR